MHACKVDHGDMVVESRPRAEDEEIGNANGEKDM